MNEISVIIPTLNAAGTLAATLAALGGVRETIVVDAGSDDATAALATGMGARVIQAARGRGGQLAAGIAASDGAWLLLLHADTRLAAGWMTAARVSMRDRPGHAAFFRLALDSPDPRARRLERLVAWRCRHLGLPYGDQGLLISRSLLEQVGGMPALPLMEDVELVRRIGRDLLWPLDAVAMTAATKWERQGWLARSARNLGCLGLYLAGVSPRWLVRLYG